MVEVGRDLKGRETKVRRWMRDRVLQNNFILYIWQLKLFYFYLSVNCLLLIFFLLFNLCGFFFAILCFFVFFFVCLFVFFCYTLPCFLLIWGDWACLVICFVVYCYFLNFLKFLFIYLFFFTFMDFLGLFFVSLIALGTSSLRLIVFPLGGWLHVGPVSGSGIEG